MMTSEGIAYAAWLDPDGYLGAFGDTTACAGCGNPSPARLGNGGCERCRAFPRCSICGSWIMETFSLGHKVRALSHGEDDHG